MLLAAGFALLPASLRAYQPAEPKTRHAIVTFHLRNGPGLQRLLANLYNPTSRQFHHFLTPEQFAARFAPRSSQVARITMWLESQGVRLEYRYHDGLGLEVEGTSADLRHVLTMLTRREAQNRTTIAPTEVRTLISSVEPGDSRNEPAPAPQHLAERTSPAGLLTPSDLTALYGLQPLAARGFQGKDQTVALFEQADYVDSDVTTFDQYFHLPAGPIQRVTVLGGPPKDLAGQGECTLDIDMVRAVAPGATILVYEGPGSHAGTMALLHALVSDNRASVISSSWASVERNHTSDQIKAEDALLQEAAAQGQSVFVASGDNGAYAGRGKTLDVSFPSSDPWVTSVGGTTLVNTASGGKTEAVWMYTKSRRGSGGGLSRLFTRPTWQSGPGVENGYSNGMRQVPDVAAMSTDVANYISPHGQNGHWVWGGGTSAAAPLWAGVTAVLNGGLGRRVGYFNPSLYGIGTGPFTTSAFHDITVGNNLYYPATPHWDFATGWGSPSANSLLTALQTHLVTARPTPGPSPTSSPGVANAPRAPTQHLRITRASLAHRTVRVGTSNVFSLQTNLTDPIQAVYSLTYPNSSGDTYRDVLTRGRLRRTVHIPAGVLGNRLSGQVHLDVSLRELMRERVLHTEIHLTFTVTR